MSASIQHHHQSMTLDLRGAQLVGPDTMSITPSKFVGLSDDHMYMGGSAGDDFGEAGVAEDSCKKDSPLTVNSGPKTFDVQYGGIMRKVSIGMQTYASGTDAKVQLQALGIMDANAINAAQLKAFSHHHGHHHGHHVANHHHHAAVAHVHHQPVLKTHHVAKVPSGDASTPLMDTNEGDHADYFTDDHYIMRSYTSDDDMRHFDQTFSGGSQAAAGDAGLPSAAAAADEGDRPYFQDLLVRTMSSYDKLELGETPPSRSSDNETTASAPDAMQTDQAALSTHPRPRTGRPPSGRTAGKRSAPARRISNTPSPSSGCETLGAEESWNTEGGNGEVLQLRQERNRLAARRSREKKKEYMTELENSSRALLCRNKELIREIRNLKREVAQLRGIPYTDDVETRRLNKAAKNAVRVATNNMLNAS